MSVTGASLDPKGGKGLLQAGGLDGHAPPSREKILDLIEGAGEMDFGGGVNFGIHKRSTMRGTPDRDGGVRYENADREPEFAVGADVEDELGRRFIERL